MARSHPEGVARKSSGAGVLCATTVVTILTDWRSAPRSRPRPARLPCGRERRAQQLSAARRQSAVGATSARTLARLLHLTRKVYEQVSRWLRVGCKSNCTTHQLLTSIHGPLPEQRQTLKEPHQIQVPSLPASIAREPSAERLRRNGTYSETICTSVSAHTALAQHASHQEHENSQHHERHQSAVGAPNAQTLARLLHLTRKVHEQVSRWFRVGCGLSSSTPAVIWCEAKPVIITSGTSGLTSHAPSCATPRCAASRSCLCSLLFLLVMLYT